MTIKITDETVNASANALMTPEKPGGWLCWAFNSAGWNLLYPLAMKINWQRYPGPLFESREQALKQVSENCIEVTEVKLFELKF